MLTFGFLFLFGVLGLVIDAGYSYFLKQAAQAAADSAAIAGTVMANENGGTCSGTVLCQSNTVCPANPSNPPVTNFDSACLYATKNGFTSAGNQTVAISAGAGVPPSASGVASATYWITATATQSQPLSFLQVLGFNTATVTAQATGALVGGAGGGCIFVLDPVGDAAFNLVGTSNVQSDCGVFVNSTAADALTAKGGAVLKSTAVDVAGGVNNPGGATITPSPNLGASPMSDPLATLPAPDYSGCDQTDLRLTSGVTNLTPGVYCDGIQASGTATLNFASGNYILNGGGLKVSSSNVTLNGSGVFFYNTSNGYAFGPVVITGGANITLTAPTSGTYKGILLFQDRNVNSSAVNAFGGGSTEVLSGSVYLPTGQLDFKGGSSTSSLTMALIAYDLNIAGDAYLKKDTTGNLTGITPTMSVLVQ